jgi:DNA-binding winged helix-turn-helix (wHTH) protein
MHKMLSFGPFSVDIVRRVVTKNGTPLRMTLKCIELLVAFVRKPGKTLSKEDLIEAAWHDPSASDATLAQHVFLLRRSLKTETRETWIETVPQVGYRFVGEVTGNVEAPGHGAGEYVEGAESFRLLLTEQGLRSAIDLYTRALSLDERNVRALARRASCRRLLAEYMYADPYSSWTAAKADAVSAVILDPSDADARIESAYCAAFFDRDFSAAHRHLDAVERIQPDNNNLRALRVVIPLLRGDLEAALTAGRRCGGTLAGVALFFSRNFAQALPYFETAANDDPPALVMLGACRIFTGDLTGAVEELQSVYREHIDVRRAGRANVRHYALALAIFALAKSGNRVRARRLVVDLAALARQRYVSPMARAIAHIALGEHDVAFAFLEEAVARFDPWAAYITVDPFLDAVRDDPRFAQLAGRLAA